MHEKLTTLCTLLLGACANDPQPTAAEVANAKSVGNGGSVAAVSGTQVSAGITASVTKAVAGSGGAASTRLPGACGAVVVSERAGALAVSIAALRGPASDIAEV